MAGFKNGGILLSNRTSPISGSFVPSGQVIVYSNTDGKLKYTDSTDAVRILATEAYVNSLTGGSGTDTTKVSKTGDTMTGSLVMSGAPIQLDTTIVNPAYQEGRIFYDNTENALSYYNDVNGVTVNVGLEHLIKVRNVNGSALADGDIVYVFSANGDNVTVKKARANLASTSRATIGVVTQACADNADTYITRLGKVHGLNTQSYNEGDTIYLSATTAGAWTTTMPAAPNRTVHIGYVTKKSSADGHILVDINDGFSLTELNDVWTTNVSGGDLLSYNTANSRWENIPGIDNSVTKKQITQNSHGFSVGNVLRYNGSAWILAQADSSTNSEALGIVSSVIDINNFVFAHGGYTTLIGNTFTPGTVYFLSASVGGLLTSTEPVGNGQVSKPMFFATSSDSGFVYNMRGSLQNSATVITSEGTQTISGDKTFYGTTTLGGALNGNITTVSVSGTYNVATSDQTIICDTSTGNITVAFPSSPTHARMLIIKKYSASNSLIIDPNTKNIDGVAGTVTITQKEARHYQYSASPLTSWIEL